MNAITRFILFIGPCSSIFDYTTFFIMLYVFGCWDPANASLFQTGWFVESLADADPDHPHHPHEPDPLPSELGELAADRDHCGHHAHRDLVAVFTRRPATRVHPVAAALLASPHADLAGLRPPHPDGKDVAT